jgi:hypothetical protein
MKYWEELTELEDAIIELLGVRDILSLISSGMPDNSEATTQSAIGMVASILDDKVQALHNRYNELFKTVREATHDQDDQDDQDEQEEPALKPIPVVKNARKGKRKS